MEQARTSIMYILIDYDKVKNMGVLKSDFMDNIREFFSEKDKLANFKRKKFGRYIPDRHYVITRSGRFHIGMLSEILKYVKSLNIPYIIKYTEPFKEAFNASYDFKDKPLAEINKPENYQDRFYQEESIRRGLKIGNGIFLLKTAAGKTYIMAQLAATVKKYNPNTRTLIIVPSIQLVEQTYKDFLYFGFDKNTTTKWSGDNILNPDANVIIASSSILLSKAQDLSIISKIDLLLYDECHNAKKANEINEIFKELKTKHRYGFTGTLPESKIDQWNIIGKIGPVIYELSRDEMVKNKFITDAEIRVIYFNYKYTPDYDSVGSDDMLAKYELELSFIKNNKFRNETIKTICSKLNKNLLLIVDRLEQGEILQNLLKTIDGKEVFFIKGEVEIEDREKMRDLMEKQDNVICVAMSKIFSTGINIKNLHYIMFASPGKAKVKLIQSIGRGVRLHENKNKLYIFDLADNLKYGLEHLNRRKQLYEEESFEVKTIQVQEK